MIKSQQVTRAWQFGLLLVLGLLAALARAQVINPLNVNLSEDTDQDGISNADEIALGLDPYNPYNSLSALDGAVFVVAWERYLGASSSTIDTDGDGWSDFDEVMVYQTNLFDERSFPGPIINLSAATASQPVTASTPTATPSTSLIKNGDFSKTGISTWIDGKKLKGYNGSGFEWAAGSVEGWSAYAGSTIEVWNTGTRVVELNGDKNNYGIQQKVETAKPGAYLLAWRSLGRTQEAAPAKNKKTPPAPNNSYFVQVQIGEGSGGSVIKKENFTAGGDGVLVFQLSENDLTAANGKGIYIAFIPTNGSNSYGSLISGVNLLPVEVVTINTFIPHNNVEDPRPFSGTIFKGDNRNSGTPPRATWDENGSHRTQQKFQVIADQAIDSNGLVDNAFGANADGNGNSDRYVHIGETKSFDPDTSVDASGNITAAALADAVTGAPLMIGRATAPQTEVWLENPHFVAPRKFTVKCRCEATNPLASGSPAISYTINITIDKAVGTYSIEGSHDGFPAYEIYINGKRVYQYDPLATGDGLGSLFPDEEYDINEVAKPLP
jgi:hypothetical protein